MNYNYKRRIMEVCRKMREQHLDGLVIGPGSDMKYLFGYEHLQDDKIFLAVILQDGITFLICNRLHDVDRKGMHIGCILEYAYETDPFDLFYREIQERKVQWKSVAVAENMPTFFLLRMKEMWTDLKMIPVGKVMADLRNVKDENEREATKIACKKADQALEICMKQGSSWIGKTEQQLEARLLYEMGNLGLRHGAVSVCFGENAAIPHHHSDGTVITEGKPLLIDFGADYNFYNTDMTRMFFFGEPGEEYRRIYRLVLEAQEKGIREAVQGNTLQAVDQMVRAFFAECGVDQFYIHRTSHGVGLDCHDYPKIPVDGTTVIEEGMIFSVEPGLYFPGKFGVRIEDQILIHHGKTEVLHSFPKNLLFFK